MSHLIGVQQPIARCTFQLRTCVNSRLQTFGPQCAPNLVLTRRASQTKRPISPPQGSPPKKATDWRSGVPNYRKPQIDPSRKATLLLSRLNKANTTASPSTPKVSSPTSIVPPSVTVVRGSGDPEDKVKTIEIDEHEESIQKRILENRRKLLWPGIWTIFAVTGTYGVLAYLDAKYSAESLFGITTLQKRAKPSQDWFLTPAVVKEGIKVGWDELDMLTIGIVIASIGVHLMKKSPLPFWEKLIHITGEKKYTAFTYPFVHSTWGHLGQNIFALCWFLPGVVRYLDGDLFQAAALFANVPLITSYLQHFAFRWGSVTGIPLNMGSSGAIAAMFGAFCVAYPDEKLWLPSFIVLRLDAKYWGVLYAVWQLASMIKMPKGGNRPAFLVHVVSFGFGAAYVYFDGNGKIWEPLLAQIGKTGPNADQALDKTSQP